MHAWITWGMFTASFCAACAALALPVFYLDKTSTGGNPRDGSDSSSSSNTGALTFDIETTYSVGLFRGCVNIGFIDQCGSLDWGKSSAGEANKNHFTGITVLEVGVVLACFLGKILSCIQRRARGAMGPALMCTCALTGVLSLAAWALTLSTYMNNNLVVAVPVDNVTWYPSQDTWSKNCMLSINFFLMLGVMVASGVNFFFAWRIHYLQRMQGTTTIAYAVAPMNAQPMYYPMTAATTYPVGMMYAPQQQVAVVAIAM